MTKLSDVDPDDLRATLETVNSAKAAMRLMVALDYLDDVGVDVMSERYGIPRSTIYSWLTRFEERGVTEAIEDRERPGRPRELDDEELSTVAEQLSSPPRESNFDADEWTPAMLQRYIERSFGVSYSLGHARRLLRELADR